MDLDFKVPPAEGAESPQPEPQETPQQPTHEAAPDETTRLQEENERLRRLVATDPTRRVAYESEKYGLPYPQQPPQRQPEPAKETGPQLPFSEDDFDPTNPGHMQALIAVSVQQQVNPLLNYVQYLQEQDQRAEEQAHQRQILDLESGVQKSMEQFVPGFSELASKKDATLEEMTLVNLAQGLFVQEMQSRFDQRFWASPVAHQEVVSAIGPRVRQMAERIGLTKAKPQQPAREMYVESPSTVPQDGNMFSSAHKHGDVLGMIRAIGVTG